MPSQLPKGIPPGPRLPFRRIPVCTAACRHCCVPARLVMVLDVRSTVGPGRLKHSQYGGTVCTVLYSTVQATDRAVDTCIHTYMHPSRTVQVLSDSPQGCQSIQYCTVQRPPLVTPTHHAHWPLSPRYLTLYCTEVQYSIPVVMEAMLHPTVLADPTNPNPNPNPNPYGWSKRRKTRGGFHHRCRSPDSGIPPGGPAGRDVGR